MSGTMQGLGATGTGYQPNTSNNSLLLQLLLAHLGSGGTGSAGMGTSVANNPMSGVLQAQRAQGMNPQSTMPVTGMQGANAGMSSMGGGNLQSLIQALQQNQKATSQVPYNQQYGTPANPTLMQGIGNLFNSGQWAPSSAQNLLNSSGTPQTLQNQLGLQGNQYVP